MSADAQTFLDGLARRIPDLALLIGRLPDRGAAQKLLEILPEPGDDSGAGIQAARTYLGALCA